MASSLVTAAVQLIPSGPLPMAISYLPILNSTVYRGDLNISLYLSTMSQLCLMPTSCLAVRLGVSSLTPGRSSVKCHAVLCVQEEQIGRWVWQWQ